MAGIIPPSVPGFSANRIRTKRVSTGSIAASGEVVVTVTWPTAFADTNYTATVSVLETQDFQTVRYLKTQGVGLASIDVRVRNDDALNARTGTIHAIAISDA